MREDVYMKPIETLNGINPGGETGKLIGKFTENWLLTIRETNPAIIDMFRERDRLPYRDLLPWSGEFAGKYLTGAYYIYRLTKDTGIYGYALSFAKDLIGCMDADGYIGCYSKECRLTGAFSQDPVKTGQTWDAWSHYHILCGLYLWYKETGDRSLLEAAEKITRLFLNTFYGGKKRLIDIGSTEMNLSILHGFTLLYQETENKQYLEFIRELEKDIASPEAGDYINCVRRGFEFFECPKPRWESLHVVAGILEMSGCFRDKFYEETAEKIFYSILKTDIHNTGAFSTDEQAIGHPYKNGAVELCCVIAYNALASMIYLRRGDIKIADFLELSYYNSIMGSYSPSGRWSTYSTPMEGTKKANYHDIVFQSRPGSPDLNCCSANSGRGLGQLSEWAFTEEDGDIFINYYGPCSFETKDGSTVKITGDYPADPKVIIEANLAEGRRLKLRIPLWSHNTVVTVNGKKNKAESGTYSAAETCGHTEVDITFDFTLRIAEGGMDYGGKRSIYYGPILYGIDNAHSPEGLPSSPLVTDEDIKDAFPERQENGEIFVRLKSGQVLCDFYRLGSGGGEYRTWFAAGIDKTEVS